MLYLLLGMVLLDCVYGVFVFDEEVYCVVEYFKVSGLVDYISGVFDEV